MPRQLLIVAHAPSPNTRRLVEALLQWRTVTLTSVAWTSSGSSPLEAGPDDVLSADAMILGTTENLGYMSGALKDFFDRTYYPVLELKQGLPCAILIRAGHDGTGTRRALDSILTGLHLETGTSALDLPGRLAGCLSGSRQKNWA
jgi:NAD(P)H-dependent FMN reductase